MSTFPGTGIAISFVENFLETLQQLGKSPANKSFSTLCQQALNSKNTCIYFERARERHCRIRIRNTSVHIRTL